MRIALVLGLVASVLAPIASAVEVQLTAANDVDVPRKGATATFGVPFAKGAVTDLSKLSLAADGKPVPAQFLQLAPWDDGSARWILVDTQLDVPAGGKTSLLLRDDGRNPKPVHPVQLKGNADAATLSTGPFEFTVDRKQFNLFRSIKANGKQMVGPGGKGLVLYRADGTAVNALTPEKLTVEHRGPMRATLCLRGKYPDVHNGLMSYTVRITAYAGKKLLKLHVWLENNGQHGYTTRDNKPPYKTEWFAFDGMAVDLGLSLGGPVKAICEGVTGTGKLRVYQYCKPEAHYSKPSHGYVNMEYTITSGEEELEKDKITDGVTALLGTQGTLVVAVRNFWENYEKAVELDGANLKLWLWPTEGQYPRYFTQHPCPGYARNMMNPLRKKGLYNMPGSVHKGHEILLDFSGQAPTAAHAELSRPLFAFATPRYYAETGAAPLLFAPPKIRTDDDECNDKLDAWVRMARSASDPAGESSIWHARKGRIARGNSFSWGYWYGWMDFGDISLPGSGYAHLHYDWPYVMLLNAMRAGDGKALQLATEMMRHRVDVDQQWSDRAQPRYHGFQRHGGGYTQFHCARFTRNGPSVTSTSLLGPVLYYFLTGDRKTLEAINRTAPRIAPAWERIFASEDYGTRKIPGNMGAVSGTILNYLALHDLTAKQQWLDEALTMFNRCVVPKWKSLGPHLHDRQQIRSQDYTRDDIRYCYAIDTFCQLHHETGDKKLFELLRAGCDNEFPENFFDAPLFLANLNAYVALHTVENNETYADNAVEFWIQGFPESKCPPVYLPGNSQWTRRKAMWMRTGHLLQYYFWKKAQTGK